ncbi:hypothetical protein LWE61_03315 [Sphingobium sufflavum]|jgi:hypothetical protein|uniref:hypothetical protein n=1 Tax=Sphingobium sufflavum TaxID=1129547 RepID=UPI001F45F74E|nr:hypothetical protein [Sphingobium sufflavum]MCE7795582.1 hypothetical protein [Sphingobium sufflavum]
MNRAAATLMIVAVGLGGCGRMAPLKRTTGMRPLPVAAGASEPATADQLIAPNTQSRPSRNVDVLTRSEKRAEDPFDLPPGPDNGRQK